MMMKLTILHRLLVGLWLMSALPAAAAGVSHGVSAFGALKYPKNFTHFDYVNPDAPKGGTLRLGATGSFDNLNIATEKGQIADGIGLTQAGLMARSRDEPSTQYAELAESILISDDNTGVTMTLKSHARWSDGTAITADDVVFSFNHLTGKTGPVLYRQYYQDVAGAAAKNTHTVEFTLKHGDNAELPLILTQLPVLPKHFWQSRDLNATSLEIAPSSGPYHIDSFDPGRSITYRRVKNFWGQNDPTFKGRYNFDTIRYDFYRDENVLIEAVKSSDIDARHERISKVWATGYQIDAVTQGLLRQEQFAHQRPAGMQGFIFNTRKQQFQNRQIRKALSHAFDFEWSNKTLFYSQYHRSRSFFQNSKMAADGLPSAKELKYLAPWRDKIPDELFTQSYQPPNTDGTAQGLRKNLRTASKILAQQGYIIKDGKRVHSETGESLDFALLLFDPAFERIALPMAQNLKKLGITMRIDSVDISQFITKVQQFDYDMISLVLAQSETPGNEQRNFWNSQAAKTAGSRNYSGIENPAVDALVEQLTKQKTREDLQIITRALDRILQFSHIVIPQFHSRHDSVVFWDRFGMPETLPTDGYDFLDWWFDPQKPINQRQ